MADMLVRLYSLPSLDISNLEKEGITIQRTFPADKKAVLEWVEKNFSSYGAAECERTFFNNPVSTFLAVKDKKIVGFASYNGTARDFFGPTAVSDEYRGKGIGKALLLSCLYALKEEGYYYAIIGGVGPAAFYQECCGAIMIPSSTPGPYKDFLQL